MRLVKVYLEQNLNRSSAKTTRTGAIAPTRKPGAGARVFFLRNPHTLAAALDTGCHSSSCKDKCGPDRAISTEKLCESMQVHHAEEMEDSGRSFENILVLPYN